MPAEEGGILPRGKNVHLSKRSHFITTFRVSDAVPPGWKPRLHVSQDGRRYNFQTGSKQSAVVHVSGWAVWP